MADTTPGLASAAKIFEPQLPDTDRATASSAVDAPLAMASFAEAVAMVTAWHNVALVTA